MIKIDSLEKLDLRIEQVNGENVVVASENNKRAVLYIGDTLVIPEKKIDSGSKVG
jgi:hypothetical protein